MKEHLRFILCQLDFPRCLFLICCRLFKGFHQAGRVPEEVLDVKFRTWQNLPEPQFFYLLSQLESHLTPWNPWSTWTSLAATFGTKIFHLCLVLLVSHPTCHAGFLVFKSWLLLVDIDPPSPFSVRSNWPSRLFSTPWRSGSKFIFHNIFDLHKSKRSRHTTDCAKLGKPRMSSHPLKANLEHWVSGRSTLQARRNTVYHLLTMQSTSTWLQVHSVTKCLDSVDTFFAFRRKGASGCHRGDKSVRTDCYQTMYVICWFFSWQVYWTH